MGKSVNVWLFAFLCVCVIAFPIVKVLYMQRKFQKHFLKACEEMIEKTEDLERNGT
jgi:hypothetical protein